MILCIFLIIYREECYKMDRFSSPKNYNHTFFLPLTVLTVATHNDGYYNSLKESAKRNNLNLVTLGYGKKWKGLDWKLTLTRNYLKKLPKEEIVIFVDAFDVIIRENSSQILNGFYSCGKDILMSVNYTPNLIVTGFLNIKYGTCMDGEYINSGTYMGYVGRLLELLKRIKSLPPEVKMKKSCQYQLSYDCRENSEWWEKYVALDTKRVVFNVPHCENIIPYQYIKDGFTKCPADLHYGCIVHGPGNLDLSPLVEKLNLSKTNKERAQAATPIII